MDRVVEFRSIGGPEQLQVVHRPVADPGPGEIQVQMHAAGLNRAELMYLAGQYLVQPVLPSKIGVEGSGVVAKLGAQVSQLEVGQPVCVVPNLSMAEYGVLATSANVPASSVVPRIPGMDRTDGAAFWMAYPTAYGGLVFSGGLREGAGQVVVITAASSSVGIAAIQVAKASGATVIATTRTAAKANQVQTAAQPDHLIVTDEEDLAERILELTHGKGFDIAFDPVMGPFLQPLADSAAREATMVEYGLLSGDPGVVPFFSMIGKAIRLTTFHLVFDLLEHPQRWNTAREHLCRGYDQGHYRPLIDQTFALDDVASAYTRLASNQQLGKVVVEVH